MNFPEAVTNLIRNCWNGCTNATSRSTSFITSKMTINMNVLCLSQFQVRTSPRATPRGFAPIFSPGPGDLYHLNCPGVGPIIKVPSCQLMPHEGTFQLQMPLSKYIIYFKTGGKL